MPKTNSQRVQAHIKRLRKKSHAFDALLTQLSTVASLDPVVKSATIQELVSRAEKAVQERAE